MSDTLRTVLRANLRDRWASIIEEDIQTDGFWEDVERALGYRATSAQEREIFGYVRAFAKRIRALKK